MEKGENVDSCPKLIPHHQGGDVCILCDVANKIKPNNCLRFSKEEQVLLSILKLSNYDNVVGGGNIYTRLQIIHDLIKDKFPDLKKHDPDKLKKKVEAPETNTYSKYDALGYYEDMKT